MPDGVRRCGAKLTCLLMPLIFTAACEAPLDLRGVKESYKEPVLRSDIFQDVAVTPEHAIFVGAQGVIVEFELSSEAFTRIEVGEIHARSDLIAVVACGNEVFALGLDGSLWARRSDGWTGRDIGTAETVQSLACGEAGKLWVSASFGTLLSSSDMGKTWDEYSMEDDLFLTQIEFPTERVGFAVGEFGAVLKTETGGDEWVQIASLSEEFYPLAAHFYSAEVGWVAGLDGVIFATHDGGSSWQREATETSSPIYRISEIEGHFYAAGNSGIVLKRRGTRWQAVDTGLQTSGFIRALAGNDHGVFLGGQALAARIDAP
ncbi:MAG: hypothetical protein VR74_13460 [Hyphomonas sp. BRH_c22]|uniref:WD40/YVTN/BNR-like repeat-containing protein n=1 Tax=Hyphomonas sp. BRH_c22 TaxID=1629710 RepID=UPI0005F1A0B6|nr:hypothetical protein [Hyphomonas sp. BRH_c22]KJS36307.1 MAG: hypothetical protein VR74_13460 [Hyphomonas sp. BRH_c22]